MDFGKFTFWQIDADTRIKSFDCGDADLNDFLFSDAVNYYKSMMALTYLLEDSDADKTVAYYSLINDKIVFDPDEKKLWNRLNRRVANSKRRKEYPAVKIGRSCHIQRLCRQADRSYDSLAGKTRFRYNAPKCLSLHHG